MSDENQYRVAHAPNPDLVGKHIFQAGTQLLPHRVRRSPPPPTRYGAWFDYTYAPNPASGVVQTKHSWMVIHDRRHYLRLRLVRTRPRQVRRPRLHQGLRAAGHEASTSPSAWSTKPSPTEHQGERDGQCYALHHRPENQTITAHAPDPDLVGKHVSQALGRNSYPDAGPPSPPPPTRTAPGSTTPTPIPPLDVVETKHSWMVIHDGITFGSGLVRTRPRHSPTPPPAPGPSCSRP